jgi:precorrin-6B methylase 2
LATIPNKQRLISTLYKGIDGFSCDEPDGRRLRHRGLVYGELTPLGVQQMLKYLKLAENDVFYDFGSGVGKLVLQVAATVPVKKCVGIEIVHSRYEAAQKVLKEAKAQGVLLAGQTTFRHENLFDSDAKGATVVYVASTCFNDRMMQTLATKISNSSRPVTLITLQNFSRKHRGLEFVDTINLQATWSDAVLGHVYRSTPKKDR